MSEPVIFADAISECAMVHGVVRLRMARLVPQPNGQNLISESATVLVPLETLDAMISDLQNARNTFMQRAAARGAQPMPAPSNDPLAGIPPLTGPGADPLAGIPPLTGPGADPLAGIPKLT